MVDGDIRLYMLYSPWAGYTAPNPLQMRWGATGLEHMYFQGVETVVRFKHLRTNFVHVMKLQNIHCDRDKHPKMTKFWCNFLWVCLW